MEVNSSQVEHIPVLARTLVEQINLPQDGVMVDATIGQGGHSLLFGTSLGSDGVIIALDVDKKAIRGAQLKLKDLACKVIYIYANFSEIDNLVREQGVEKVDFILADLGLCSSQLSDSEIGLSFQTDMPLDMRIDKRLRLSAADIINKTTQKNLADLIFKFGQERFSRRIARFIVRERQGRPITTTGQLSSIICRAVGQPERKRKSKIHPATRTFQALRIAVNNELENLEKLLASASGLLGVNGRIAIISFHSLEDRLVKLNFKANEKAGIYKIITKKPIVASREEISSNQRARSAKLRIAEKT
ncbi:MAG: 16S rRNA (cytosine(1402)-N(4))-methyltransferase RsmH [Planctomycetes bacterium]|nr:16S rRNA (cytosine(1402)-N(4))-methyltransferase RsmH [Planctomycetota bacterium]